MIHVRVGWELSMRKLLVGAAAREIKQACLRAKARSEPPPFSFVVGAGLSYPPVLLASQIVEHCRQEARSWEPADEPSAGTALLDVYSYWFGRAYPQAADRQSYLREMMEKAHISRANFRLAHLLLDGTVGQIVVTPNFDDLLSRALALFGLHPVVCDHPQTVERIDIDRRDVQLVHVHGTYWFYDCANLKEELDRVSHSAPQESFTMSSLLDNIFRSRVPLVIGYAGWEGDVIMGALRRRIAKPLPRDIYWFCYRLEEMDAIPTWLKNHQSVVAVVPDDEQTTSINPAGRESTLDATRVLDTLIRELQLAAPEITRNPLGFFAQQLRESLWIDDGATADDVYGIRALIERVERAQRLETALDPIHGDDVEAMREAIRRSDYREAIRNARKIDLRSLGWTLLQEIATSMFAAAQSFSLVDRDAKEDAVAGYEITIDAGNVALRRKADDALASTVAQALMARVGLMLMLERAGDGLVTADELIRRFGDASDPLLRKTVVSTLHLKAIALKSLERIDDEVAAYDEVIRRFGGDSAVELRRAVASALLGKGDVLDRLGRADEAMAAFDEVIRRVGDDSDVELRRAVLSAVHGKGDVFHHVGRADEAIAAYDKVIRRSDATDLELQPVVTLSLLGKMRVLGDRHQTDDAIAAYDEFIRWFGEASDPLLRVARAHALNYKADLLLYANRSDEALAAFEEMIRVFGDAPDPRIREHVARALNRLGTPKPREAATTASQSDEQHKVPPVQ
jgi:tetratricopeptide (TPR) repeat protein